jgi:hypothetical protein
MNTVKIIEIKIGPYNPLNFTPPWRIIAKVNGITCDYISKRVNSSLQEDLKWYGIYKTDDEIMEMIEEEAVEWYHSNIKIIRKEKLNKLNNIK